MKLLTKSHTDQLLRNGELRAADEDGTADFLPVVKLFTPDAACTWLLAELDPDDPDIAFGLCDLGLGCCPSPVRLGHYTVSRRGILNGEETTFRRGRFEAAA